MTEQTPEYDPANEWAQGASNDWEQEAAQMRNVARLIAIYHKQLARNGVPPQLAYKLVRDYHQIFLMTSNS